MYAHYADDLVILSPSVSALSELMQVCGLYGLNHDINVPDSKAVIRNLVYKFMHRLAASYNKLVIAIINSDIR